MSDDRLMRASARWARLLLRLYPADFREEMGSGVIETYLDHCRAAVRRGGLFAVSVVWLRALMDSLWNGIAERLRPAVSWRRSGDWGLDVQRAVRRLLRTPMFSAAMIGTLTVGLGAFATVYTVVDRVLLAPLPYERPDDLYFVWRNYSWVPFERGWVGGTDVVALEAADGVIDGAVGLRMERMTMTHGSGGEPAEVPIMLSTPNLFKVLGVQPARGRAFAPNEGGPGRPAVIVLSDNLWRDRFGGDPQIVGSEVRLDGRPFTVIGVARRDFHFKRHASEGPPESADAYITFEMDLATTSPNAGAFATLVRARAGTTPEVLAAAVGSVGSMVDKRDFRSRGLKLYPVQAKGDLVARVRPALIVLGSAGVFLVLVLAVNLATLLLARVAQREREFAISRALGANHVAIARATVLEGGLLGLLGGIGGTVLAVWGTRALVAIAPADLPRREAIGVDWRIAVTVAAIGTVLGLLAALLPAMWATRTRLMALLANTNVRGGGGGHGRMRRTMVVVQVALSLVLLTTGGLVVRSFERLLRANPGFDDRGVLSMRLPVSRVRYETPTQANALHERLEREISALPGVKAVGGASALPLTAGVDQAGVGMPNAPGNTGDKEHDQPLADFIPVRGRYFEALGIRVIAGRLFAQGITPGVPEALIDRTMAERFFPNGNAVGARLIVDGDSGTVIGVVEHARQYDIHKDGRPQVYIRNEMGGYRSLSFAIKTDRAPEDLIAEVRAAVHRVDPELAIADLQPMRQVVDNSLKQQKLSAVLVAGFSLGALALAAMGLFGVVSSAVNRRRHEIAVRLALGADHGQVRRLLLKEGAGLIIGGMVLGLPGIYFAGKAVAGAVVGVSPFDAVTLASVGAGLVLVALAACYIPARRVTGIEPAQAFRED